MLIVKFKNVDNICRIWSICLTLILSQSLGQKILSPLIFEDEDDGSLLSQIVFIVNEFRFVGNTVIDELELAKAAEPFTNREVYPEELEELRHKITVLYLDKGYINSGAVIRDQNIENGVIKIDIIEGSLTEINIEGNNRLRSDYISKRIMLGAGPPLNVNELQDKIKILTSNANIRRINAELKPGATPGKSYLDIKVDENHPQTLTFNLNNHRTPSVGAERLFLTTSYQNVTGISDQFDLTYGITKGDFEDFDLANLDDIEISYTVPLNSFDTTLELAFRRSDFSVIEEPFADLNIESESENFSVTINHPVLKSYHEELILSLSAELRQSKTFLLGRPFSFSVGTDDGRSRVAVFHLIQHWVKRSLSNVIAARSSFNFGIDAFHATKAGNTTRDGKFMSWLGQFQYVQRLGSTANQLIFKSTVQWTDDELLSLEQFSLGGSGSIRGYRENQLVRDKALVTSIELRFPILFDRRGKEILQLAPFLDYGRATNNGSGTHEFNNLTSAGLGILFTPFEQLNCQLYWGYPFREIDRDENDLQDKGIHFNISFSTF